MRSAKMEKTNAGSSILVILGWLCSNGGDVRRHHNVVEHLLIVLLVTIWCKALQAPHLGVWRRREESSVVVSELCGVCVCVCHSEEVLCGHVCLCMWYSMVENISGYLLKYMQYSCHVARGMHDDS